MHITNGKLIKSTEFRPVVKIKVTNRLAAINCTGTFVNPRTVLTAAHCLINSPSKVEVSYKGKTYVVDHFEEHPIWKDQGRNKINSDIALLNFKEDVSSDTYQICNFQPEIEMNALIVGMGLTHAESNNNWDKKIRKGYIQIDNINEGNGTIINLGQVETTTADGTKAGTSAGDSGGPLLITQDNNNYCVMAITRSGYVKDNTNVSIYENLKLFKASSPHYVKVQ